MSAEQTTEETKEAAKKKSWKGKLILTLILTLSLAGGAWFGRHFMLERQNYIITDNARITTTLIPVSSNIPGRLESLTAYTGQSVRYYDILGWIGRGDEVLRAPVDGIVVHVGARENQVVSPLEPIVVIADTNNLHIEANIEETDVLRVQPGQSVTITIDALGSREFRGYVRSVGNITNAELSGNALFFNTGGTFTRVIHLIPVEIVVTDHVRLDNIIGTNARVRIAVG